MPMERTAPGPSAAISQAILANLLSERKCRARIRRNASIAGVAATAPRAPCEWRSVRRRVGFGRGDQRPGRPRARPPLARGRGGRLVGAARRASRCHRLPRGRSPRLSLHAGLRGPPRAARAAGGHRRHPPALRGRHRDRYPAAAARAARADVIARAQVLLTTLVGLVVGLSAGLSGVAAALIGLAVALSSSVVIVNITRSRRRTTDRATEEALLGWSVVQDVTGVILAAVLIAAMGSGGTPALAVA